jgi:hypothetical protein
MLQRIRDGLQASKAITWVILGAIGLTFVFWGGSGALDLGGGATQGAATVDGEDIPAFEATRAWSETQNRWATQVGTEMTDEQRKNFQQGIIDSLVMRKVIESRLRDGNYRVSEQTVLGEFQNIPPKASTTPTRPGRTCSRPARANANSSKTSANSC